MTDQAEMRTTSRDGLTQVILGFLARGWNGEPAPETADRELGAWAPRPDMLFRATRAAFGAER